MDSLPKWVLIIWLKIPQIPQNLFAQFVCPNQIVLDFNEKKGFIGCPQSVFLTYFCPFHSRMYSNEVITTDCGSIDANYRQMAFFEIAISFLLEKTDTKYYQVQGRHGEFEQDKAQHSTPNFFDRLFLIRVIEIQNLGKVQALGALVGVAALRWCLFCCSTSECTQ